jgi:hypothetical protein
MIRLGNRSFFGQLGQMKSKNNIHAKYCRLEGKRNRDEMGNIKKEAILVSLSFVRYILEETIELRRR